MQVANADVGGAGGYAIKKVKISISGLEDIIKHSKNNVDTNYPQLESCLETFLTNAGNVYDNLNCYENNNKNIDYPLIDNYIDDNGNITDDYFRARRAAISKGTNKVLAAKREYGDLIDDVNYVKKYGEIYSSKGNFKKFNDCMHDIQDAMVAFEEVKADFVEKFEALKEYYTKIETYGQTPGVETIIDPTAGVYYQFGDRAFKSTQGLKETFTAIGTTAMTVYLNQYLAEENGWSNDVIEELNKKAVNDSVAFVSDAAHLGLYEKPEGMSWQDFNTTTYKELTGEDWDADVSAAQSDEFFSALGIDPDDFKANFPILTGGGYTNGGAAMGAAFLGSLAYSGEKTFDTMYDPKEFEKLSPEARQEIEETYLKQLTDNPDAQQAKQNIETRFEKEKEAYQAIQAAKQQEETQPTANPLQGGGGAGGSGDDVYEGIPDDELPATEEDLIKVPVDIDPIEPEKVPIPIKEDITIDIDKMAAEKFFNRTPEEIAAERANALSAVDQAFAGEGVEEFKAVLSQGGFDDVDISIIMENKEIAVTAYILASESKSLTDIANSLAAANNIQNFDTMYDNGLSRMSLENGLAQSKLMAEIDNDVMEARTNVQTARNNYNDSVKKANDSIEDAEKKKEEMEEIKRRIIKKSGEDTSKWEDEDIEAYNKAIEKYNEANRAANSAHKEALQNKELLDQAETKLTETQDKAANKYLDEYGQNGDTDPGATGDDPAGDTPTGETGELGEAPMSEEVQQIVEEINTMENAEPTVTEINTEAPDTSVPETNTGLDTGDISGDSDGNLSFGNGDIPNTGDASDIANVGETVAQPQQAAQTFKAPPAGGNAAPKSDRNLTSDDILDLLNDVDGMGNTDTARSLESVDLGALAPEDRVLPGTELNSVISGNVGPQVDVDPLARQIAPSGEGLSTGNGLVDFSNGLAEQGEARVQAYQNVNAVNNFTMNTQGYAAIEGDAAYANSGNSSESEEPKKEESVGVQIDTSAVERHTDGVLVGSDDEKVTSEVSDDGRSLDFVEVE